MNDSNRAVQIIAKICKIICSIVYVCCIIGIVCCIVGIVGVAVGMDNIIQIKGIDIHTSVMGITENIEPRVIYAALASGIVVCWGNAIVASHAGRYFRHEIADGTPFTVKGAKEIRRLGIITIIIPMVASIIAQIIFSVIIGLKELNVGDFEFEVEVPVGMGLIFIILSFVFMSGAENAKKAGVMNQSMNNSQPSEYVHVDPDKAGAMNKSMDNSQSSEYVHVDPYKSQPAPVQQAEAPVAASEPEAPAEAIKPEATEATQPSENAGEKDK